MNTYEIIPGVGVGPIHLGMTRADVTAALEASGTSFRSFQRWPNTPDIIAIEGSAFQVFFDADDRVESIELSGTPNGDRVSGSEPRLIASIEGVDVFRTTAVDVVSRVVLRAPFSTEDDEYPATYSFPSIGVTFWRSSKPPTHREEEDPYFESILVTVPSGDLNA